MTISYLPMTRDFTVYVGATFSHTFHWTSGGLDVDLSGWDAWMPYGSNINTSLGELSVSEGSIILTAEGRIKLYLTDEQTEKLFGTEEDFPKVRGVTTLVYQLSLQNEFGEVIRFMRGNLYLQYDVRRPGPPTPPVLEPGVDTNLDEDTANLIEDDLFLDILDPGHMSSDVDELMVIEDIVVTEPLPVVPDEEILPPEGDELVISDDVVVTEDL